MAFLINITYIYIYYITYFMIHFLGSEISCHDPKLDNPLFSLRFNDQSSKCRWICTNVPEIQKDLPPNHEELPLGSLSSMRNWEFTLQPLSKLKWVVISSTKVILTRFSCLEWSSFYTWDSAPFIPLSASAKTNGAEGFMGVIGYQDWRSGGGCPGGTGKLLPNI